MKIQKTSIKKTLAAAIILSGMISLVAFETMVYGQEEKKGTVAPEVTNDLIVFSSFPISIKPFDISYGKNPSLSVNDLIWEEFRPVLNRIKLTHYSNLGVTKIRFLLEITQDRKSFYDGLIRNNDNGNYKTEFIKELTVSELEMLYQELEIWVLNQTKKFPLNFEIIAKKDFLNLKYVIIASHLSSSENEEIRMDGEIFKSAEVDQVAEPVGGMGIFINNIALNLTKDETVNLDNLPDNIDFEFVVGWNGIVTQVNLISDINGSKIYQDKAYKLMGNLNKNILKYSNDYGWKPAIIGNKNVSSRVRIQIPKSLL